MDFNKICEIGEFQSVLKKSETKPVLVFKHSTRCNISSVALSRIQSDKDLSNYVDGYLIDVISCRALSSLIADHFDVRHESPQVLMIHRGECIFDESHLGIFPNDLKDIAIEAIQGSAWRISS